MARTMWHLDVRVSDLSLQGKKKLHKKLTRWLGMWEKEYQLSDPTLVLAKKLISDIETDKEFVNGTGE